MLTFTSRDTKTSFLTFLLAALIPLAGCQERPGPKLNPGDGTPDASGGAGGDSDGSVPSAPDFGFVIKDGPIQVEPDVGPGVDAPPIPTGPTCGDGKVEAPETCDDSNAVPGDGCSGVCTIEPNYECPTVGAPCVSLVICGDGKLTGSEACDDGGSADGDGCSSKCEVEMGWTCPMAGQMCKRTVNPRCGDGSIDVGEGCDDANTASGDGCTSTCTREPGWKCPTPGMACVRDSYCGDGHLDSGEQCDDGNNKPADGCTGACTLEPFYTCPTPGQPCTSTIICGDSKITGDEACDDGNTNANDGCANDCKRVEAGYTCPNTAGVGGMCTKTFVPVCGDGLLSFGELCDDGGTVDGDGCSADCKTVQQGWRCTTPGMKCTKIAVCGDGILSPGEQCDDGNTSATLDGCSANCVLQADWICPNPGQPCTYTVICGDGRLGGTEQCDDSNTAANDGCSSACAIENGWTCPPGQSCRPTRCGDGLRVGGETCDDGNTATGDGCSATCTVENPLPSEDNGWKCVGQGPGSCTRTTCGDGTREGSEACDDAKNSSLLDGCTPACRSVPTCPTAGGPCVTACGDGLLLATDKAMGQDCDDGNKVDGDGCSSTCKIETGYACSDVPVTQDLSRVPTIFRDFRPYTDATNPHPDFERFSTKLEPFIVQEMLAADGEPMHVPNGAQSNTSGTRVVTTNWDATGPAGFPNYDANTDYFSYWYRDNATYNRAITGFLPMTAQANNTFQYDAPQFFPVDGMGFGNQGAHNWSFTTEARAWFQYQGGEVLDFIGDDDVWVFINKKLAVDLGGMHTARHGTITLDASNGHGQACDFQVIVPMGMTDCPTNPGASLRRDVNLGMTIGNVYEIVVFQAERHSTQSSYKLTLTKFAGTRSSCAPVCGDHVRTPGEECDDGSTGNNGAYGGCTSMCKLAPRCGDAVVNGPEQCDDGLNRASSYTGAVRACVNGCKWSGYCGDATVNGPEQCDKGSGNNNGGYGGCNQDCTSGPSCGDGAVNGGGEECDDGASTNGTPASKCTTACKLKCGNAMPDPGEACDDGTAANVGGYGKCTMTCQLGPRCGDGIVQPANEACDDGKNDGTYGTCAPKCVLAPRCGDGVIQTANGELCDNGANNMAAPYGKNLCDQRCRPAPYCGDKEVDSPQEKCDDGMNTGQPGSCKTDCSDYVPLPSCGDGVVQSSEQCDQGAANGTAGSTCDVHCKLKCGNGTRDPGEACDNGVNDGSYGTCKSDCTLANYCGDGVKGGPEQCDQGTNNMASPYGPKTCTTSCLVGPYCGDGRIQTTFGEKCDSTPDCSNMCKPLTIM